MEAEYNNNIVNGVHGQAVLADFGGSPARAAGGDHVIRVAQPREHFFREGGTGRQGTPDL